MFIDFVKIHVQAGRGGDGCLSFRRTAGNPKGGPDGGNGGLGGHVFLEADTGLNTLLEFRHKPKYHAQGGTPGMGNNRFGPDGESITLRVPVGTMVRNAETGELMVDMNTPGQVVRIARGGKGGKGNWNFATPIHQVPYEYEEGEEGEAFWLELELKLIADVGLVGLPNAGKSTILARLTAARPKIADYPFTTLKPQLGIARGPGERSLTLADIPGLIEGAHQGVGLGHEFLRHIERTKLLAHIVDLVPADGSDPVENIRVIQQELQEFSEELASRPVLVVANKADLTGSEDAARRITDALGHPVVIVSAATGQGLDALVTLLFARLDKLAAETAPRETEPPCAPIP